MKDFALIKDLTHHAYILVRASVQNFLDFLEKELKIKKQGNPDFFHEKYETLNIDESRKIKEVHLSKPFSAETKRIFIIEAESITHEAQNSLLKIFEEPHAHTHFFIIMPSAAVLLPTLRSRVFIIESKETIKGAIKEAIKEDSEEEKEAKKFLKLSVKEKLAYMDDLAKKISDEELQKSDAKKFLGSLEIVLKEKGVEENKRVIKAILKSQDYLNDRSPSIKQLLEFVALSFNY